MITYILWTIVASLLGLSISAVFAGKLRLQRSVFLVPYVLLVSIFLYCFVRWENLNVGALIRQNWIWGVIAAVVVAIFMIRNVFSQPVSPRSQGSKLLFELFWFGLVYGAVDGLFLSVFPVLMTWQVFPALGNTVLGRIEVALLALIASELITLAYHVGYPEFRNSSVVFAAIGNGIITIAYLVSLNPISAIGSHVVMHIAAVWHGSERTVQLPPHYGNVEKKQAA